MQNKMAGEEYVLRRFYFKISIFLVCGFVFFNTTQGQFTACTTPGNYTDDIYRDVPIKNSRTSVTVSSPDFPQHYPLNIQCTWRIQAPEGLQVLLSFLEFQLEKQSFESDCHDYVSVRDGGLTFKEAVEILRRCGSDSPPSVHSTGRVLWMRFLSDKEGQEKGFSMKVVTVSGTLSKRYIALGVLVALLFIIIVVIIVCRKRFRGKEAGAIKVRQYQELPIPTDTDLDQTNSAHGEPEVELKEDIWNSECNKDKPDSLQECVQTGTLNLDKSGQSALSDDGLYLKMSTNNRSLRRGIRKKVTGNEDEELEFTELLTVI